MPSSGQILREYMTVYGCGRAPTAAVVAVTVAVKDHPNVARIRDVYATFANGDFAALNDLFAEDLLWHQGGRNQLSGEYRGREAIFGFVGKLMEVTEGSFHVDPHAILADDEHGAGLVVLTASRGSRSATVNAVDVMHLRDLKVVEWWTVPSDPYALD